MTAPTTSYDWATSNYAEHVISPDGESTVLVLNKVAPDVATQQAGVTARKPVIRSYYNYMLNSFGQWIGYLRAGEIGDFKFMAAGTTPAQMTARFTGTWTDHGTDTFAGQTVQVLERTA